MANKLFTFLGTNDYLECNYYLDSLDRIVKECRFIQSAIIQLCCLNWSKEDYIIVFTTKEAQKNNWETPNKFDKPGLKKTLESLNLNCNIKQVEIPEGKNIDELWKIFEIILDNINDEDNIIFDITHSFRSLPMLSIIILNYAKFLKKIRLNGIYYGAVESLGSIKEIYNTPVKKRDAPIFDLTPFVSLLDWTVGVERFINTGDATIISHLANEKIRPIMANSKGSDKNAKITKHLVDSLSYFSESIATCRASEITNLVANIKNNLNEIQKSNNLILPMKPILDKIGKKFEFFSNDENKNQLQAVKWCKEHNLIQQGFTLLQEFIISYICKKNGYDISMRENREFISACISVKSRSTPEQNWNEHLKKRNDEAKKIINLLDEDLSKEFLNIGQYRNDLNHAGYVQPHTYRDFVTKLDKLIEKISRLIT